MEILNLLAFRNLHFWNFSETINYLKVGVNSGIYFTRSLCGSVNIVHYSSALQELTPNKCNEFQCGFLIIQKLAIKSLLRLIWGKFNPKLVYAGCEGFQELGV